MSATKTNVTPEIVKRDLAQAVNQLGAALVLAHQAIERIKTLNDQMHEYHWAQVGGPKDVPGQTDDEFSAAVWGEEYPHLVQLLDQIECASYDCIDFGGTLGHIAEKSVATPEDGIQTYLRLVGRATMQEIR